MFRTVLCIAAIGCAALAHAQTQPPVRDTSAARETDAIGTGIIRGRVTEAGTNRPLAHALVRVTAGAPGSNVPMFEKLAATDAGGRFEVAGLAAGIYTIGANKANYLPQNRGEKRPIGPGVPIALAPGQVVENVTFALLHAGAATGRITDEFGEPLPDTQVSLMRWFFTNGERRLQPTGGVATTNDLGEFRVFNVRPGQYIVAATLRPNQGPAPNGRDIDRAQYTPTYYPGTPNPGEAQKVTIGPGQTATGMSFALLPAMAAQVSGTVIDSQGKPLANGNVVAMPRTSAFGINAGGPIRDGKFSLTLTPGDYTLRAMKPGGSPVETETALFDVSVAGSDIPDLLLVTANASTLRGRFVFESGDAKAPAPAAVRVVAQALTPAQPGGAASTAKENFTFELKTLAGRVMIRAPAVNEWRLRRVMLKGADITDTGLDVPPNATVDGLVVELTPRLGQLSVRVLDDNGSPTRDGVVVVFARDSARWTPLTRFVASGMPTPESGTFAPHMPAGEYLVAAFAEETPSGLWNDPEVLNQLREHAVSVSIADDEKKAIDVRLGAAPVY
jgi:hypothetical protein